MGLVKQEMLEIESGFIDPDLIAGTVASARKLHQCVQLALGLHRVLATVFEEVPSLVGDIIYDTDKIAATLEYSALCDDFDADDFLEFLPPGDLDAATEAGVLNRTRENLDDLIGNLGLLLDALKSAEKDAEADEYELGIGS
jgi:hypothetical protein